MSDTLTRVGIDEQIGRDTVALKLGLISSERDEKEANGGKAARGGLDKGVVLPLVVR